MITIGTAVVQKSSVPVLRKECTRRVELWFGRVLLRRRIPFPSRNMNYSNELLSTKKEIFQKSGIRSDEIVITIKRFKTEKILDGHFQINCTPHIRRLPVPCTPKLSKIDDKLNIIVVIPNRRPTEKPDTYKFEKKMSITR